MIRLVGIDPGRDKCGLVLTDPEEGLVLEGRVLSAALVPDLLNQWQRRSPFQCMLIGNGTSSSYWARSLASYAPLELVEEKGTTLRARARYWELWPPVSWRRLLPKGLMIPPDPLDAVAALVLLENHIGRQLNWPGPPTFKIVNEL